MYVRKITTLDKGKCSVDIYRTGYLVIHLICDNYSINNVMLLEVTFYLLPIISISLMCMIYIYTISIPDNEYFYFLFCYFSLCYHIYTQSYILAYVYLYMFI